MRILTKGTYYGSMLSEIDVEGIQISEYDYNLPRTDWHHHENPYFMYVIQGQLFDRNKHTETLCAPGSLIFHNWQEAHWNENHTQHARGFHIEFERNWYKDRKLNVDLWEGSQRIEDPLVHHILGRIYSEFHCQDEFSALSIELLMLQLCESVDREKIPMQGGPPVWIETLKEIIHDGIGPLDLKSLAAQLGVHPVHISRAVPKYLSSTLGTYIRHHRVKRSLSYLINSRFSLTEIAYTCGFSDQSHFIRSFKGCFNMTPSAYRAQLNRGRLGAS